VKRDELLHVLRAAAAVTAERRFIVIGSQSILGWYPTRVPPEALRSVEADLLPMDAPDKAELIGVLLGEGSPFDEAFGYHADGVGFETAVLPEGWQTRLKRLPLKDTQGVHAYCLEPHDLLIAKYVANRPKDREFCQALARSGLVAAKVLRDRLAKTDIEDQRRALIFSLIESDYA
jgi:hypothetical protein